MTKELNGGRIRIARTEMDYKHGDGSLTSAYPLEGPGNYQKVMGVISERKLLRPTTAQTFSLIDFALNNSDDEQCKDILSKIKGNWLWTATENLWGEKDVILYDNIDGNMPSGRKSLLKRMKDGDKAVRVVPYGFVTGSQSVSDLVKNPYIIGQVGSKNFAEDVIARVARKISKFNPYVFALGKQNTDIHRYTAVDSNWNDTRLSVYGDYHCVSDGGYASGVLSKSAEATSQKSLENYISRIKHEK